MTTALDPVWATLADMQDEGDRLMAADRLDELGLPETARLLRDARMPLLVLCGAVLLGVRLDSPSRVGVYPVSLWNPDGTEPALQLRPPRGWQSGPFVVADRLRFKVAEFCVRRRWCDFYEHCPARRRDPRYESCLPCRNNFWVLPLNRQDRKDFWAAVR
jgi:hypothetical protein